MKLYSLFIVVMIFNISLAYSQKDGSYIGTDGVAYKIETVDKDKIVLEKGEYSDTYERVGSGSIFNCMTPEHSENRIRVDSDVSIFVYVQDGGNGTQITYQKDNTMVNEIEDCGLSQKYMAKMESDKENGKVWSYCGYVASLMCNTEQSKTRKKQLGEIISILKDLDNSVSSPCPDVISQSMWDKY